MFGDYPSSIDTAVKTRERLRCTEVHTQHNHTGIRSGRSQINVFLVTPFLFGICLVKRVMRIKDTKCIVGANLIRLSALLGMAVLLCIVFPNKNMKMYLNRVEFRVFIFSPEQIGIWFVEHRCKLYCWGKIIAKRSAQRAMRAKNDLMLRHLVVCLMGRHATSLI